MRHDVFYLQDADKLVFQNNAPAALQRLVSAVAADATYEDLFVRTVWPDL